MQFTKQHSYFLAVQGQGGPSGLRGRQRCSKGQRGCQQYFRGQVGVKGDIGGVHGVKGCVSGAPGGQGGRLGAPGVKGGFLGVPKDQRPHLMGPLMICKALKVISGSTWVMGHV